MKVDSLITDLENRFKDQLDRFGKGSFEVRDFGRPLYNFIGMHYVRSHACTLQIRHVLDKFVNASRLSPAQADAEFQRLALHQDPSVFKGLVNSVASTLTGYEIHPVVITGPQEFITSNKIVYAGLVESEHRTMVWFPLSPKTGLSLFSDFRAGQILGPVVMVNSTTGRVSFNSPPEPPILKSYAPSPQAGDPRAIKTLNGLMVPGSSELFGTNREVIDDAIAYSELATGDASGYAYKPPTIATI